MLRRLGNVLFIIAVILAVILLVTTKGWPEEDLRVVYPYAAGITGIGLAIRYILTF
jgi:hypothetical protein